VKVASKNLEFDDDIVFELLRDLYECKVMRRLGKKRESNLTSKRSNAT
jgi:hypothetical protein